jgi:hypothetical protein
MGAKVPRVSSKLPLKPASVLPLSLGRISGWYLHRLRAAATTPTRTACPSPRLGAIDGQRLPDPPARAYWAERRRLRGAIHSVLVGRIVLSPAAPKDRQWMWSLDHRDRSPTRGSEPTREAAMAAFAKSWRRNRAAMTQRMTQRRPQEATGDTAQLCYAVSLTARSQFC